MLVWGFQLFSFYRTSSYDMVNGMLCIVNVFANL